MSIYLDTSVLVPLFVDDVFSEDAETVLQATAAAELATFDTAMAASAGALGAKLSRPSS